MLARKRVIFVEIAGKLLHAPPLLHEGACTVYEFSARAGAYPIP
jgi:hypothetical protein